MGGATKQPSHRRSTQAVLIDERNVVARSRRTGWLLLEGEFGGASRADAFESLGQLLRIVGCIVRRSCKTDRRRQMTGRECSIRVETDYRRIVARFRGRQPCPAFESGREVSGRHRASISRAQLVGGRWRIVLPVLRHEACRGDAHSVFVGCRDGGRYVCQGRVLSSQSRKRSKDRGSARCQLQRPRGVWTQE